MVLFFFFSPTLTLTAQRRPGKALFFFFLLFMKAFFFNSTNLSSDSTNKIYWASIGFFSSIASNNTLRTRKLPFSLCPVIQRSFFISFPQRYPLPIGSFQGFNKVLSPTALPPKLFVLKNCGEESRPIFILQPLSDSNGDESCSFYIFLTTFLSGQHALFTKALFIDEKVTLRADTRPAYYSHHSTFQTI